MLKTLVKRLRKDRKVVKKPKVAAKRARKIKTIEET